MSYTYHNLIGIEIGAGRVRIVKPNNELKVKSVVSMEISDSVFENGKLEYTTVLAQSIKDVCATAAILVACVKTACPILPSAARSTQPTWLAWQICIFSDLFRCSMKD
ncbi:MAG: hypothetical protein IKY44_03190, partial [Clostridia bacterium]|nr:hypothetical protein [Clostridia bacterium]